MAVNGVPLHDVPRVRQIGIGVHGSSPVERYRMLGHWCVHLYCYHAKLRVDEDWYEITPGCVTLIPPTADLEYHFNGRSEHAYAHFAYDELARGPTVDVPILQHLGSRFADLDAAMRSAVGWYADQPQRSAVRLWDVLWSIAPATALGAAGGSSAGPAVHPALSRAIELIEIGLTAPLRIDALAAQVGLSHNHLTRLFVTHKGMTPIAYLRHRRVTRAIALLQQTTRPIKAIAIEVGIPDLHLFNKTIRKELGRSPTDVRRLHVA